jgi:hypothetical protein
MARDVDFVVGMRPRTVAVLDECSPIDDRPFPYAVARTAFLYPPSMLGCIAEDALEDDESGARCIGRLRRERVHARMQHWAIAHNAEPLLQLAARERNWRS